MNKSQQHDKSHKQLKKQRDHEGHETKINNRNKNKQTTKNGNIKQSEHDDSYIRKAAIKFRIPYITTATAASATTKGIAARRGKEYIVKSLQNYHAEFEKSV